MSTKQRYYFEDTRRRASELGGRIADYTAPARGYLGNKRNAIGSRLGEATTAYSTDEIAARMGNLEYMKNPNGSIAHSYGKPVNIGTPNTESAELYKTPLYQNMWGLIEDQKVDCGTIEKALTVVYMCCIAALVIGYVVNALTGDSAAENEKTDPDADPEEVNRRQKSRGELISIIGSALFSSLNGSVDFFGDVNPATSTALIGLLLGGTIGYLLDIGYGTDIGKRIFDGDDDEIFGPGKLDKDANNGKGFKMNRAIGMDYCFATLATGKFARFILVTMIDLFISLMIFSVAYPIFKRLPVFRCMPALANATISALISIITFRAYANQTRFQFAYPDANAPESQLIQTTLILLAAAVSSVAFLKVNTMFDLEDGFTAGIQGINHPKVKVFLVMMLLVFISIQVFYQIVDPEIKYRIKPYKTEISSNEFDDIQSAAFPGEPNPPKIVSEIKYVKYEDPAFEDKRELLTSDKKINGRVIFITIFAISMFSTLWTSKHGGGKLIGIWCVFCLLLGLLFTYVTFGSIGPDVDLPEPIEPPAEPVSGNE